MAVVVISLMASLAMIAWTGTHWLGHLAHDKSSLVRAADAAAFSAAVVQARTLNLLAFLNRAQLAHQVAMAHLITVASAERFRATQAQRAGAFNPPASVIGMLFGARHATAYLAARAGNVADQVALGQLEQAFRRHDDLVHDVIVAARAQQLRDLETMRDHEIRNVLTRNLGSSGSSLRSNSLEALGVEYSLRIDDWPGSVAMQAGDTQAWQRLLHAVTRQHGYLNPRDATRRNFWAVSVRCPHKRHELRRRGETTLDRRGNWRATDSLSYHALRSNQTIGCYHREYPMGWAILQTKRPAASANGSLRVDGSTVSTGQAQPSQLRIGAPLAAADDEAPQRFSDQAFWRWVGQQTTGQWDIFNGRDNRLASRWAHGSAVQWSARSRPGHADLHPGSRKPLRIALEVRQTAGGRAASRQLARRSPESQSSRQLFASSEALTASSAAHAYFLRPHVRNDGKSERPNLFHPYWHARLIPMPADVSAMSPERGFRP